MKNSAGNKRVLDCLSMNPYLITRVGTRNNRKKKHFKKLSEEKTDYLNGMTDCELLQLLQDQRTTE